MRTKLSRFRGAAVAPVVALVISCSGGSEPSPGGSCIRAADCVPGEVCVGRVCQPMGGTPRCTSDQDCPGGYCDLATGACQSIGPAADTGVAGPGDSGIVIDSGPKDVGETDTGATPDTGPADTGPPDAGPPGCTLDSECPVLMEVCEDFNCVLGCAEAGGYVCPSPSVCNPATNHCVPGDLPLGDTTCVLDDQCGSAFCLGLTVAAQSIQTCSLPCSAGRQCPIDFNCTNLSGMGVCLSETLFPGPPPATWDVPPGGMCTTASNTCQTSWCDTANEVCIETCFRVSDCTGFGGLCWNYERDDNGTTRFDRLCFDGGATTPVGAACTTNANCETGICSRYANTCAVPCCADADCGATQSCLTYDLDASNVVKICVEQISAGAGVLGAPCTMASECASEVCAPVDPSDAMSPSKCSTLCCTEQDCAALPLGGRCRPSGTSVMGTITGVCFPN